MCTILYFFIRESIFKKCLLTLITFHKTSFFLDYSRPKPVTQVPYFKDFDLLTSASLNGGDVFAKFVNMLKEWTQLFAPSVTEEEIYEQLINKSSSLDFTSKFQVEPPPPKRKPGVQFGVGSKERVQKAVIYNFPA